MIWAPDIDAESILERARTRVEELEQSWSRFRPTSELSRLNRDPNDHVGISDELAMALDRCLRAWSATGGLFDPTVEDAMVANGYGCSFDALRVIDTRRLAELSLPSTASPGMTEVSVTGSAGRWVISRPPGVRFDLGGIGKGLAADMVSSSLLERGARSACISIGGDVRVIGDPPDGGWLLAVEHPTQLAPWFDAIAADGAIVASTTRIKNWQSSDGRTMHHLVDPSSGSPTHSGIEGAVVHAAEGWWAEALATALVVAGPDRGVALCEQHDVAAWMVTTAGDSIVVGRSRRSGSAT